MNLTAQEIQNIIGLITTAPITFAQSKTVGDLVAKFQALLAAAIAQDLAVPKSPPPPDPRPVGPPGKVDQPQ